GMVTGNAESDRPHSCGHLCRFVYPRTGDLSWRYRQSCSEVASAKSDVLGGSDDCSVRARGRGSSYESHGASRRSPADHDARALWATRVGTLGSCGSHSHTNWSETAETFAIAGTAWILADLLGE